MLIMVAAGIAGIVLLSVAADQLVLGAARLATRMSVAPVVVGIVVIGLGTSAPELLVSGTAARAGHTTLAIGNLTGSNVLNLTLVLGLAGLTAVTHLIRTSRTTPGDPLPGEAADFSDGAAGHGLARESVRAVLGLAGTLAGAELLVTNAAGVAARLGVSQQVIGFTLVALGTSLPELVPGPATW